MTDRHSTPLLTAGVIARAAATGLAGAGLSAERHPVVLRSTGLVLAGGAGVATAVTARSGGGHSLSPQRAAAVGVGIFLLTAGASEAGLRGQRRLERWAARVNGHPRLTVGVLAAAASVAADVADRGTRH